MAKELLLGKYEVDFRGRLYVDTPQGRWYPVDWENGRMVVMTRTLLYNRQKARNFEPADFPRQLTPLGRPHIDRGRLPGQSR